MESLQELKKELEREVEELNALKERYLAEKMMAKERITKLNNKIYRIKLLQPTGNTYVSCECGKTILNSRMKTHVLTPTHIKKVLLQKKG